LSNPESQPEYDDAYKRIKPVQKIIKDLHDTNVEQIRKK
jgi:hypothetical protein